MRKNKTVRIAAFVGSAALTVGLLGAAASATGAYFQDTEEGTLEATIGSIDVRLDSGTLKFSELLPGVPQKSTIEFKNVGKSLQDVYIRFDAVRLAQIEEFATIKINGTQILTGDPVRLANNLAEGVRGSAQVTVELKSTVEVGDFTNPNPTVDFELIATQDGVAVDA